MKIRKARKSDLREIAGINSRLFRDSTPAQALRVFQHCLRNSVPGSCLVAEEKGGIIGAIMAEKKLTFSRNAAYITSVFVKKAWRGKGVGKMLFERCLDAMKRAKIRSVSLSVEQKNKAALGLYKKKGFSPFRLLLLKRF